jgi:hypothetical protein
MALLFVNLFEIVDDFSGFLIGLAVRAFCWLAPFAPHFQILFFWLLS